MRLVSPSSLSQVVHCIRGEQNEGVLRITGNHIVTDVANRVMEIDISKGKCLVCTLPPRLLVFSFFPWPLFQTLPILNVLLVGLTILSRENTDLKDQYLLVFNVGFLLGECKI